MNALCKGSYVLGTACGECERCINEQSVEFANGFRCGDYSPGARTFHESLLAKYRDCLDNQASRKVLNHRPDLYWYAIKCSEGMAYIYFNGQKITAEPVHQATADVLIRCQNATLTMALNDYDADGRKIVRFPINYRTAEILNPPLSFIDHDDIGYRARIEGDGISENMPCVSARAALEFIARRLGLQHATIKRFPYLPGIPDEKTEVGYRE